MKAIAEELDRRLAQLSPPIAEQVERLVRDADIDIHAPLRVAPRHHVSRTLIDNRIRDAG